MKYIMKYIYINFVASLIVIILFGFIYAVSTESNEWYGLAHVDNKHNLFDLIYFSFTTFSTAGYGDIRPLSRKARILVILEQLIVVASILSISHFMIHLDKPGEY